MRKERIPSSSEALLKDVKTQSGLAKWSTIGSAIMPSAAGAEGVFLDTANSHSLAALGVMSAVGAWASLAAYAGRWIARDNLVTTLEKNMDTLRSDHIITINPPEDLVSIDNLANSPVAHMEQNMLERAKQAPLSMTRSLIEAVATNVGTVGAMASSEYLSATSSTVFTSAFAAMALGGAISSYRSGSAMGNPARDAYNTLIGNTTASKPSPLSFRRAIES